MPNPRPLILRLFLRWLKESRSRFLILAPRVVHCTDTGIFFTFPGPAGNLSGYLNRRSGIIISVNYQGECWDLLGDFDTVEEHSELGYYCRLCLPESRRYYQSREDLWREHTFEEFLRWCNETLAPANWLVLYEYHRGVTEAKLMQEKPEEVLGVGTNRILIPLRM